MIEGFCRIVMGQQSLIHGDFLSRVQAGAGALETAVTQHCRGILPWINHNCTLEAEINVNMVPGGQCSNANISN